MIYKSSFSSFDQIRFQLTYQRVSPVNVVTFLLLLIFFLPFSYNEHIAFICRSFVSIALTGSKIGVNLLLDMISINRSGWKVYNLIPCSF